jgi:ABC-type transport system involved in multi-copper enzyme maturation permease subunit
MSSVRLAIDWCRQSLSWKRSWIEHASAAAVVVAAIGLWFLGGTTLPLATQLVLWAAWLLAIGILHHAGYLPLFGPVLFYDMVRTARRNRYVLIRTLYAGFLLMLLFWVYGLVADQHLDNRAQAARLAQDFFEWLMVVQLIAVVLLTPAYVGGAIADEKERRTLEFILATDLRNQEVVLSKLGSRLANLALFLLTGLPIISLLQFLGGIDPNLVLAGFAVTGITLVGAGSVSLFYSVFMRRPRDAIGLAYLFMVAYFALATLCLGIKMAGAWNSVLDEWLGPPLLPWCVAFMDDFTDVINAGSPLALIIHVARSGQAGALATDLPGLLRNYAAFHFTVAGICLGWSIVRLRRVGLKQTVGREIKASEAHQERPPVGELPMLWKELLEGNLKLGWPAWIAIVVLAFVTLGIGIWICIDYGLVNLGDIVFGRWHGLRNLYHPQHGLARDMNIWARITGCGVACVTLLWVAVRASTSISGERDKQTFDALITTQLGSDSVLGAKLLGSLIGARLGAAWLAAILLLACLTGGVHPFAVPLTLGAWVLYACFFAMVGLFCSMVCSNSTKATVATVLVSIMAGIGHWLAWLCIGPLFFFAHSSGPDSVAEYLIKFQFGMSPPCVLIWMMYSYPEIAEGYGRDHYGEGLAYCLLGLFLWGAACLVLWFGSLTPRFREVMRREHGYAE